MPWIGAFTAQAARERWGISSNTKTAVSHALTVGVGKAAVRALLKASTVGVQAWRRGTAGIVDEE